MISQLTVFMENERGRLASACRTIADAGINMYALFVADTADFGVARIFCDTPQAAAKALTEAGYRAMVAPVLGERLFLSFRGARSSALLGTAWAIMFPSLVWNMSQP